jgi:IPT/TIG domain
VVNTATNTVTGPLAGIAHGWAVAVSPLPQVTGISPASGATAGGNQVAITGPGIGDATAVSFGGVPATSFTVVSPDGIEAVAPPGTTGIVDVTVTTPRGTSLSTPADRYDYLGTPTVTALSPLSGTSFGGTVVTITGVGFSGATTVHFGSAPATINSQTLTRLTVTAPAGALNSTVDVTVTTPLGTSATGPADRFSYRNLIGTPPNILPAPGGGIVEISFAAQSGS